MNLRKSKRLYKLVSYTAIASLILPIFMTALTPQRAEAQGQAPMQVGVVEFRNDSGVQGEMLARFATDAVVIELSKSNRYDVITRQQIETQMKDLGLVSPLDTVQLSRLGEALAAEAMIQGSVKAVEVRGDGPTRRAAVTIVVRMVDQSSGEVINGAIQTGYSNARVGYTADDDKLIAEALDNAAYLAVKTMIDYIIPEVTVLNTIRTNEVLLNKGARDGVRLGMRMIVIRDREVIGVLEVHQVDANNAEARVTKATRGIRPEDKARAVFDMPEIPKIKADPGSKSGMPATTSGKKKGMNKITKTLLTLAAVVAIGTLFSKNGESVGAVAAEAGLSGFAFPTESGMPGVRVRWSSGSLGSGLNVIEYHIWRNDISTPILKMDPAQGSLEAFDDANGRATAFSSADAQTHARTSGSTTVPAMTLGRSYKYFVSALYMVDSAGGSQYFETQKKAAGQATPIAQVQVADMRLPLEGSQQNLHKVTFEWLSKRGADCYVVEASSDPLFASPQYVSNTVTFSPGSDAQPVRHEVNEALYNTFNSLNSETPIYWRVGARASSDSPGPIPADGRSNMRYIYSEVARFYPVEMPPPQPN